MESLRWEAQIPNSSSRRSPNFYAPSWMATTSLDLGLELGAWKLGWCFAARRIH
jgi:hypothetical protein